MPYICARILSSLVCSVESKAPLDFYDEKVEKDKLFFDAVSILKSGDLDKMPLAKV
jgi:hypothetical protein